VAVDHVVVSRVLRLVRWSHVIRDLASVHVNHSWKKKHAMNAREGIILSRRLICLDVKVRYQIPLSMNFSLPLTDGVNYRLS
jgi:hypothetical protein